MAQFDDRFAQVGSSARTGAVVDEGLRAYMLSVYNYMAAGVALTGLTAYVTQMMAVAGPRAGGQLMLTPFGEALYLSPLKWVVMLAPLALVFFLSYRVYKMSLPGAQLAFWAFAAAMGLSLSSIFLVFTGQSIARVFFISAAAFAGLSAYGYTTRKDLSGWGSFLIMGVIGMIIAGLVNLWLQSTALQFAISVMGVVAFAGLTAYDTQRIKDSYFEVVGNTALAGQMAIMGALSLYLDFINLFVSLLNLFGERE